MVSSGTESPAQAAASCMADIPPSELPSYYFGATTFLGPCNSSENSDNKIKLSQDTTHCCICYWCFADVAFLHTC